MAPEIRLPSMAALLQQTLRPAIKAARESAVELETVLVAPEIRLPSMAAMSQQPLALLAALAVQALVGVVVEMRPAMALLPSAVAQ